MTRRTAETHRRDLPVAAPGDSAGDQGGSDNTTVGMPLRTTSNASVASRLPQQMFSTAYGLTVRAPIQTQDAAAIASTKKKFYTIVKAGLLIPGDGEPFSDAALVIENKIIAWIGQQSDIPDKYSSSPHRSYSVPYLMPGLWDVHVHFGGGSITGEEGPGFTGFISMHPASGGARLARGCWEAIQRGYTSLRDVAGFGCEVAKAVAEGEIVGPNIYSAGACLSQTAGHGDVFNLPAGIVYQNLGVMQPTPGHFGQSMSCVVDGVDECRRAVRLQIRRGAKCIKILASGGVMSRDDEVQYAQFSDEELKVIVEEAARQGRSVAAHVHAKAGILAAVKAGVKTVEHVSFGDQECIDLIKKTGTIYVATRLITEYLLSTGGEGLDPSTWEKAKLCGAHHLAAYKLAIDSGCTFAMGTDTPPGVNMAIELEYAVQAGLSNLEAIKAATANGPLTVGAQAPKTGQLKVGYEADILGLTANPVEDVRVLQDKDNIKLVWKGGKIFKGPGVGPWGEDRWWGEDPWR
ncbi:amidohydrolase [Diaporthe amygdali]|uniref:amidohydrolase n=1 Tax=Phomopsis amygdali TaxID=1214568 RepID=UPI0022FE2582|nr:amidohydrolase [Diaporthe amygdali]KAJ0109738.1 amidohydrolase [Diaporthe amygdali]